MRLKRLPRPRARKRPKKPANDVVQVVVGLRNPGPDYEGTRHNIGHEVLSALLARYDEELSRGPSRVPAMMARVAVGGDRTLLVAPNTFMNESGSAVGAVLHYYKVEPSDLLVVHDDIDLPFGRLRVQVGGGSGGHNGIRSLERALGTNDFSRLKIGVGRPPGSMDPADYVLRSFSRTERAEVDVMVQDAADVVERWLSDRVGAQELAAHRGRYA